MNVFRSDIIGIYQEQGEAWLDALPQLVTEISSRLNLSDLKEVTNLTYNHVLSGFQGDNPIIDPECSHVSEIERVKTEILGVKW